MVNLKNPFKRGKEKFSCEQGQDGKVVCKSFREFEDGTKTELAGMEFSFDGTCKGVADSMWENEEGALTKLEKKAYKRIQDKCKSSQVPQDY